MSETAIERAIRFRRQDAALHCDLAILADAYIAHLDEQEALNVPYDREWLEARPEFERIGNRLIACTRINPVKIVWYLIANSSEHWCLQWCGHYIEIPAPATKADVIKLLEMFA